MPKAKRQVKEWKPKVNKLFKSTFKNKNSQQYGVVGKFGTGWRPYIRPYFPVADFDLGKCIGLPLHEDFNYLKSIKLVNTDPGDVELDTGIPPEEVITFSPFGAVFSSMFSRKKVDDKEERKYKEVSLKQLPPPPADLFIQTDMRDVRWGTSPSAVSAIELTKDLDAARIAAIKLMLDYKLIKLQEEEYELAQELGIQAKVASAIEDIEI